jgi:hypothetical protein
MTLWGLDTMLSFQSAHGLFISPASLLAQLEAAENLSERVLADITLRKILRAILTVLIAYGSLSMVQDIRNLTNCQNGARVTPIGFQKRWPVDFVC